MKLVYDQRNRRPWRHARSAFSGEGARLAGGRWNLPGNAAVYTSSSLALAAIETFVHIGDDGLHIEFVSFRPRPFAFDPRMWKRV